MFDQKAWSYMDRVRTQYSPLHLPIVLHTLLVTTTYFDLHGARNPLACIMACIQDTCQLITENSTVAAELLRLIVHRGDVACCIDRRSFQHLMRAPAVKGQQVLAWAKRLEEGWEASHGDPMSWLSCRIMEQLRSAL